MFRASPAAVVMMAGERKFVKLREAERRGLFLVSHLIFCGNTFTAMAMASLLLFKAESNINKIKPCAVWPMAVLGGNVHQRKAKMRFLYARRR